MSHQVSPKLKPKTAGKWMSLLAPSLYPGEMVWALAKTSQIRPHLDVLVVTNARVIAFSSTRVADQGPDVEVVADEILHWEIRSKPMTGKTLVIKDNVGELSFGVIAPAELDFVRHYVQQLVNTGPAEDVRAVIDTEDAEIRADEQRRTESLEQIKIVGNPPKDKEWEIIHAHAASDEAPWLLINPGAGSGLLAAFKDRLLIAKVSVMASLGAGSFGGGRVTAFPFPDITNVEYNSGLMNGVLEVLTPSYQGTGNHDFWRSTGRGRNRAADNPFTLSNCLPLPRTMYKSALPHLTELQRLITESKQVRALVQQSATAPSSAEDSTRRGLASELKELAELHQQGILDAAEFAAAKQSAIVRYRGLS